MLISNMLLAAFILSAPNGTFTRLNKGERAKFSSWCYDDVANTKLLLSADNARELCEVEKRNLSKISMVKLDKELSLLRVSCDFRVSNKDTFIEAFKLNNDKLSKENDLLLKNSERKNTVIIALSGIIIIAGTIWLIKR